MEPGQGVTVALVVAAIGIAIGVIWYLGKRRREAWRDLARRWQLNFSKDGHDLFTRFGRFKITGAGRSRRFFNKVSGELRGHQVTIADYRYTTGSGRNAHTHHMTLLFITHIDLVLPHFFLRRQRAILDRLGKLFGGQDIDFEDDPAFSSAFVLQGHVPDNTRSLFHPGLRQQFIRLKGTRLVVEAMDDTVAIHDNRRFSPGQAKDRVEQAMEIVEILRTGGSGH